MTTTVRLDEEVRDRLQQYKNRHRMTYSGGVMRLLEIAETASEDDEKSTTEQNEATVTTNENAGHRDLPDPQRFYREGASGAVDFVVDITRGLMRGADEYGTVASHSVWTLYNEMEIEPRIANRSNNPSPPNLDDLVEHLSYMIENAAEYTLAESEHEVEHVQEEATRIQRALSMYQKIRGETEIPLESEKPPNLIVPRDRTYTGKVRDHNDIVTADGEKLDPRPDLNSGVSEFSWGYTGTGPHTLAVALLADAYTDRYARARGMELKNNLTSKLPMGEPWEITAGEIEQYLNES